MEPSLPELHAPSGTSVQELTLFFRYFIPFFTYDFEELNVTTTYYFEEFQLAIDENFDIILAKITDFKALCSRSCKNVSL